jgi:alginate O-acetyltransferase complex protein AlgI
MLFCTTEYALFLSAIFALYWMVGNARFRVWLLLVSSFAFYASWSGKLACLVLTSSFVDFWLAKRIEASRQIATKKRWMILSVGMNLGLLGYFKYANFFLQSLQDFAGTLGVSVSMPLLNVIVPIGISFYTFEAINYIVDVYRGKLRAERDLPSFLLFILFFPHLIAGPIVRASDFLPQIRRKKTFNWARIQFGLGLILLGMIKKLALADRMIPYVDPVFSNPGAYDTLSTWMASIAFALQVYGDFSGYSDIAIGSAHLLGFRLAWNFNLPFVALNIADFWRRWHLSLSTWMRDYLFIPMGGSRGSFWQTSRNLTIVMMLGGFWHGASWNYLVWGCFQGILLSMHRLWANAIKPWNQLRSFLDSFVGRMTRIACTFAVFCITLVIFRAGTLADASTMLGRLFQPTLALSTEASIPEFVTTLVLVLLGHIIASCSRLRQWGLQAPLLLQATLFAVFFWLAVLLAPGETRAFIYFQF